MPAVPWHPLRAPLAWDCAPRRPVATWQFPRDCAERLLVHGVPDDDLLHSARCQPPRMFGQPDQHHGSCVRGWSFGGEKQNCQRKLTLGPNLPAARFPGMPSVRWGKTHACPCAVQHSCTCAQTEPRRNSHSAHMCSGNMETRTVTLWGGQRTDSSLHDTTITPRSERAKVRTHAACSNQWALLSGTQCKYGCIDLSIDMCVCVYR